MEEEKKTELKKYLILAALVVSAAVIGIFLGQFFSNYELRFFLNRKFCGTYRGIDVYKTGEINTDNFLDHVQILSQAPDILTDACETLYFTGSDLPIPQSDAGYSSALGLTQKQTVYISTDSYAPDVVVHELFHAYDYAQGMLSENSYEFRQAYEKERNNLFILTANEEAHASEFFATAGAVYLISPRELLMRAPKTYEYFKNIFENAENSGNK